jgi:hypothetical protein
MRSAVRLKFGPLIHKMWFSNYQIVLTGPPLHGIRPHRYWGLQFLESLD